jgi:hypothetical protein
LQGNAAVGQQCSLKIKPNGSRLTKQFGQLTHVVGSQDGSQSLKHDLDSAHNVTSGVGAANVAQNWEDFFYNGSCFHGIDAIHQDSVWQWDSGKRRRKICQKPVSVFHVQPGFCGARLQCQQHDYGDSVKLPPGV